MSAKRAELGLLVNSRNPIVTVETSEEARFSTLVECVAEELGIPLYVWSVTSGLGRYGGAGLYNSDQPEQALTNIATIQGDGIFLLKDFCRYCDNDRISRRLRDLADGFRTARRSNRTQGIATSLDTAGVGQLAKNLAGLSEDDALRVLRQAALARHKADAGLLDDVLEAKRQAMHTGGLLETIKRDASFADVAGLQRLREWIGKRKNALTPEGQRFGLVPPKGVLITGVQGCGKSLAAKAIAGEWGYELARLDAGALYDKFVGESEKRLKKALDVAQKISPAVLWIDEIEKAFASAGSSGDADAGLSQRLLATLLTWMQDRESGVFLAATSNNITILPPEMLRKGRFDEIFFVDLPGVPSRTALFALHIRKRGRDAAGFDLAKLAGASDGFSGAEIEQVIAAGLYTAFEQKQQLSTEILLAEIRATQPLSVTRAEEIASIRNWAKSRAVPAD